MKNNIEKLIHNWSSNIVRLGCLSVVLLGTSEWLMYTSEVNDTEYTDYAKEQPIEDSLPILKKVLTL